MFFLKQIHNVIVWWNRRLCSANKRCSFHWEFLCRSITSLLFSFLTFLVKNKLVRFTIPMCKQMEVCYIKRLFYFIFWAPTLQNIRSELWERKRKNSKLKDIPRGVSTMVEKQFAVWQMLGCYQNWISSPVPTVRYATGYKFPGRKVTLVLKEISHVTLTFRLLFM